MKKDTHEKYKQLVIRGGVHKVERPKVINDAMLCTILQNGTFIMKITFVVWFLYIIFLTFSFVRIDIGVKIFCLTFKFFLIVLCFIFDITPLGILCLTVI